MPDIKIKRYADKENLKKLMKYSKDTFANKNEINDKFYTKEQIDTMLGSGSGGTGGGGGTGGDYYTKSEIDTKLNSKANTSDLSTVATSGSYNDLLDKPTPFDVDLSNYYTKSEVDNLLSNIGSGTEGGDDAQNVLKSWPDGPEAHNAMWGGRDITAAFNNGTVSANIADGTFRDIFPGDYITKSVTISGTAYTVNWVIADCDYWINKGDTAMTAHHVAIVPQAPIFNANMNATNTTEGGYAGSRMYKETIPACATGIVSAFGSDHILTFRDLITNTVDNNVASRGYCGWTGASAPWEVWASVQCNLMTEHMVMGAPHYSSSGFDDEVTTRQMSAFRLSEGLINYNRQWWWFRNVVSSTGFARVHGYGDADPAGASAVNGVRPFALLV